MNKLVEENDNETGPEETPTSDEGEMGKLAKTGGGTVESVGKARCWILDSDQLQGHES